MKVTVAVPIGDGRSGNLIDSELLRQLYANFRRYPLQDVDAHFRVDLRRVFAHANQFSERAAQSERLTRTLIINFASPGKCQRCVAASVGDPAASRRRFGMLEQQTAADVHIDSLARQLDHGMRHG